MPKVWSEDGFKFYIYYNDHKPSHVHVKKRGCGEVVIYIGDRESKPSVRELRGMESKDAVKAIRIAAEKQKDLIRKWRQYHVQDHEVR